MSIADSQGQLARSLDVLMLHWHRTRDGWRDTRAREFEEQVLLPLESAVRSAQTAMDGIANSLDRARAECSAISEL